MRYEGMDVARAKRALRQARRQAQLAARSSVAFEVQFLMHQVWQLQRENCELHRQLEQILGFAWDFRMRAPIPNRVNPHTRNKTAVQFPSATRIQNILTLVFGACRFQRHWQRSKKVRCRSPNPKVSLLFWSLIDAIDPNRKITKGTNNNARTASGLRLASTVSTASVLQHSCPKTFGAFWG